MLMHLAGQSCAPPGCPELTSSTSYAFRSLLSEIQAAFPKVPLPPGRPSESPRRSVGVRVPRLSMNVNAPLDPKTERPPLWLREVQEIDASRTSLGLGTCSNACERSLVGVVM